MNIVELRTLNAHRAGLVGGETKAKIFVSYSRKDKAFADRLNAALKARGFEPLIDHGEVYVLHDSPTGRNEVCLFHDSWQRIQEMIIQADTIIFVLSPDAVTLKHLHQGNRFCFLAAKTLCASGIPDLRQRRGAGPTSAAQIHLLR